jgi:16S rRNA (adenine1518-N6/adenine1519-N6)-dimethyltransferase
MVHCEQLCSLKLIPNKRLGQHFLVQKSAIQTIARTALAVSAPQLLEIGPGQGAITEPLLVDGRHLWAVDIDPDAIALLSRRFCNFHNFHPIQGDAVHVPLDLHGPLSIVGNLPYNAATAILTRFLLQPIQWERMVLMFQLEVGQKLMGKPGDKEYGPLSILAQLTCCLSNVMKLGPGSFYPPPKVNSIVIMFEPKLTGLPLERRGSLLTLLRTGFRHRRKTLANNLYESFTTTKVREIFEATRLPTNIRAEAVSPDGWLTIFNTVHSFI